MAKKPNITIEDAQIAFRNFTGKEDKYNRAGDRNFVIILRPEDEARLLDEGWNVKYLKARDEGDAPQPYIQVAVAYGTRPPKMVMVTSKNLTYMAESDIEMLDWVDIETADVTMNPYEWDVNGKSGVKAYAATVVIKIVEDYLVDKWTLWVEAEQRKALPSGNDPDWIEGQFHETTELEA